MVHRGDRSEFCHIVTEEVEKFPVHGLQIPKGQ